MTVRRCGLKIKTAPSAFAMSRRNIGKYIANCSDVLKDECVNQRVNSCSLSFFIGHFSRRKSNNFLHGSSDLTLFQFHRHLNVEEVMQLFLMSRIAAWHVFYLVNNAHALQTRY